MNKFFKNLGLILAPLVLVTSVVAGIMETRGDVKILDRRIGDTEHRVEKQEDSLNSIRELLQELRTEQKVQGQMLKGFLEEYYRKKEI